MNRVRSCTPPLGVLFCSVWVGVFAQPAAGEPELRLAEPLPDLVADLDRYIPDRMSEAGVPGLAIAVIRDYEIAWTEGYGAAHSRTGRPVTAETVFEVASISKPVTTYTALRLVERGALTLDDRVARLLSEPWLPPSTWSDRITLRHLASHSSGLTDRIMGPDKSLEFEPGTGFLYSGVGLLYMQAIIERLTGLPLDRAAAELTFDPLQMSSSSFVNADPIPIRTANGHVGASLPLLSFLVPGGVLFLVLAPLALVIQRALTGRWIPLRRPLWSTVAVASGLTLVLDILVLGGRLPGLALLNVVAVLVFGCVLTLLLRSSSRLVGRFSSPERHRLLRAVWAIAVVVLLLWLSTRTTVQIPRCPSPEPSPVGSLRSSAGDLARFLIEVTRPRHVSPQIAREIRTAQVRIDDDFSWGLGLGIQHSSRGDALWQMGITLGFRSVVVIYPEHGWGVVVLTNSDDGLPVAYDVAGRALGGKANWSQF